MVFKKGSPVYATEVQREQGEDVLYINAIGAPFVPSIAESPDVMARAIDLLADNPNVSRIVFVQQRNYHYPNKQVLLLAEIARLYNFLTKQEEILSPKKISIYGNTPEVYEDIQYLLSLMKQHPIGCYLEIKTRVKELRSQLDDGQVTNRSNLLNYLRLLEKMFDLLNNTTMIKQSREMITESSFGKREIYKSIFRPEVLPNFTFTRLAAQIPEDAELIDQYEIKKDGEEATVTILRRENDSKYLYHIMPPEYALPEEYHILLNLGRNVLSEHRPKSEEFTDPERTRKVFMNIAKDLLSELSKSQNIPLTHKDLVSLSKILVRHTIGFGLIEVLLSDEKLQDIVLNAPITQNPIFVRHEQYDECVTNIVPSFEDSNSWAAKLRLQSGRPLDEANPVLDTEMTLETSRARVAATTQPLSPKGLAYAFRRHRDQPWTLPLFIDNKMINSFTAGLLSFFIDGSRTLLVAGTRSSGKTSLLGSLMLEIMPKCRVIVIEDTLELPVNQLRKLGYNIQQMKVAAALLKGSDEIPADEGIRTTLRMGDSCLIVGEVRSTEAYALYEAMRVGALANVVAGTIHGDSPYGVFDRVVNDLKVPRTSFKATDIIVVANPIKSSDGLHRWRRVTQITEVRKYWEDDPLKEKGFVDLMKYDAETDRLEPSKDLINGDSDVLKSVASNVKEWAGNWDAVWDNIMLRAKIKEAMTNYALKANRPDLLEADFSIIANDSFHKCSDMVKEEVGSLDSKRIFFHWNEWMKRQIKKV